jgi:glycosyltransferase involved in cell wall biosynthesis
MPEIDRDSGSRRVFHLIEFLQETGWAVSFVSHHPNPGLRYVRALQQRGIEVYSGSSKWMDQLIATGSYDLAVFGLWDNAESYLSRIRRATPTTRIIVDSIDLHFLRNARRTFREPVEDSSRGMLDSRYASEMIRELNTYAAADAVLAVSQKEADMINDLVADPNLAYAVPDNEDLSPSTVPLKERQGIVFIGCFRHAPNVRAVEYLCQEILPRVDSEILARHPVYIVGDGMDETVRSFGSKLPHVRMVGWVPSVAPYLERARISVVPLLYGAGTKRKLLQALMFGTPAVSTSIGVEGLNLQDSEQVLIADDPVTFADSITRLLKDDELWQHLERGGRAHITAAHGREAVQTRWMQVISAVLAKDVKPEVPAGAGPKPARPSLNRQQYQQLVHRIRDVVQTTLPSEAGVIVVSKGDFKLLDLGGRRAWHFPQSEDGRYAGYYPADSNEAIAQLERLRTKGGDYLLLPSTAFWWLEHYAGFKQHLEKQHQLALHSEDTCLIYALRDQAAESQRISAITLWDAETTALTGDSSENGDTRLIAFFLPQFPQ